MHFNDLKVYQLAIQLEKEIFNFVQKIQFNWNIEQVAQIKRSSASISANIVEGWTRRFYPRDFIRFLSIALGSSDETQHHLKILYNKQCIDEQNYQVLSKKYQNLSVRILNFIRYLKQKHQIPNLF